MSVSREDRDIPCIAARDFFKRGTLFFDDPSYERALPENYAESWFDPAYAVKMTGEETGRYLSLIAYESLSFIPFKAEGRREDQKALLDLFLSVYDLFLASGPEGPEPKEIKGLIRKYVFDSLERAVFSRIREQIDPSSDFAFKIITESDLSDPSYLKKYGEYYDDDTLKIHSFVTSLSEERIKLIADTFTEGYKRGFIATGKDITKKKTVSVDFTLGFERIVKEVIGNFEKMGLKTVFPRRALQLSVRNSSHRVGYGGAVINKQMDFDHRDDRAVFFDSEFVEKRLEITERAYKEYEGPASVYGGPSLLDTFGDVPFTPVIKKECLKMSAPQQKLMLNMSSRLGFMANRYMPGDERSYTMISFPVPEIGPDFKEIFDETVRINTLDNDKYRAIQEKLILTLEKGRRVRVRGKGKNKTDITVSLHALKDPAKETVFENCLADVNIPVGEVFTSPSLPGTSGTLFVSEVYLFGRRYENLEFKVEDGYVKDYTCTNFPSEEKNKSYIKETILHNHETLPIGEFAIGTNTAAYSMAKKYDIFSRLDILIAEKTGPHFAFGDTCYSREEDVRVCNPDGREIVSRDNEYTVKRKEDKDFRYFECHTDVTIPYDELDSIVSIDEDGNEYPVIEDGLFVVPGCEELNKELI